MLTMKDVIREGHPTLRQKAQEVSFPISDELRHTAHLMMEFLKNSQDEELAEKYDLRPGVGLAAPQIDVSYQLFALYAKNYDEDGNEIEPLMEEIVINPQIISHSRQELALSEGEGCLSVDREVPGYVPRAKRIRVRYQDLEGEVHEVRLRNYEAIVFQHEYDHLQGIMFYDRINADDPWYQGDNLELLG